MSISLKKIIHSVPFLAIISCLLWATPFVGIKIGLQYTSPLHFAGMRFLLAGILVLPFIPNLGQQLKESLHYWRWLLYIALLQTTFLYALFYIGLAMVPGSVGAMIVGSNPIFIAITAHFMIRDERMTLKKTLAVLIGVLGVITVSLSKGDVTVNQIGYGSISLGIIILIVKNFLGSFGNIIIAKRTKGIHPRLLSSLSLIVGAILLLIIAEPIEQPTWELYPPIFWVNLVWLALVSSIAISIWYTLLQRPDVKVTDLNLWTFIIPVFGAIFSWLILPNEHPQLLQIVGMLIIVISLIMINLVNRQEHRLR